MAFVFEFVPEIIESMELGGAEDLSGMIDGEAEDFGGGGEEEPDVTNGDGAGNELDPGENPANVPVEDAPMEPDNIITDTVDVDNSSNDVAGEYAPESVEEAKIDATTFDNAEIKTREFGSKCKNWMKTTGKDLAIMSVVFPVVSDLIAWAKRSIFGARAADGVAERSRPFQLWDYTRVRVALFHVSCSAKEAVWKKRDPLALNNLDQVKSALRRVFLEINNNANFELLRQTMTHMTWSRCQCDSLVYLACIFESDMKISQWNFNMLAPVVLYCSVVMDVEHKEIHGGYGTVSQLDEFLKDRSSNALKTSIWRTYDNMYTTMESRAISSFPSLDLAVMDEQTWSDVKVCDFLKDLTYLATHTESDPTALKLRDKLIRY